MSLSQSTSIQSKHLNAANTRNSNTFQGRSKSKSRSNKNKQLNLSPIPINDSLNGEDEAKKCDENSNNDLEVIHEVNVDHSGMVYMFNYDDDEEEDDEEE